MGELCHGLHEVVNARKKHRFPFIPEGIPLNGIYVLFEEGERAHGSDRIVRIGTHTGQNQLRARLNQHFIQPNKDRSIFRKNIGRALLHQESDPFLEYWNLDLTSRANRDRYADSVDFDRQAEVERRVTEQIQGRFFFTVFEIAEKAQRLALERRMIGTVSHCEECGPTKGWPGAFSPKPKICASGLWQEQHLSGEQLDSEDIRALTSR